MPIPAPSEPAAPTRMTVERYFALVDEGLLEPEDRVELLEGEAIGPRAAVRCQCSIVLGRYSAPEPDVAVVAGRERDYMTAHPRSALLLVEVADTSLAQDRLTKGALYAAAGIPEYWIVNLRADCVEVLRDPQPEKVPTSLPGGYARASATPRHRTHPRRRLDPSLLHHPMLNSRKAALPGIFTLPSAEQEAHGGH